MRLRLVLAGFVLSMLFVQRVAAEREVARFAIVIGNNLPESSAVPALRYADDDAVATHRLLEEAGVESVLLVRLDEDSRRLHSDITIDGPPGGVDFQRAYATVATRIRKLRARGVNAELLIFYSGHGDVEGGEGYVRLEDERLTRSALYALLADSPAASNHVFIDACKSYFLAFEKGPGGTREPYTGAFKPAMIPAQLPSTGFVLSTSSDRDSHEWERYQAGILSHELRSALRGAADADRDGRVTYAELGAFLTAANQGITNARFRPDFMVRAPDDNLRREVLRWHGDRDAVRVNGSDLGHLYVETANGERVLDVHPKPATTLTLHLPAQRPLFVRGNDETREYTLVSRELEAVAALSRSTPQVAPRGALHVAFGQLFAAPFGPDNVQAFERAQQRGQDAIGADSGDEPTSRRRLRLAAGVVALAGAATGLALTITALAKYEQGADASQVEVAELNRSVRQLNIGSVVCYVVAGVAGATWAGLFATRRRASAVEPVAQLEADPRGGSLSVRGAF